MKQNNEEYSVDLTVPRKIHVHTDKKTNAQSIALPFRFLDGGSGVAIVTRLEKETWVPAKDIKSIKIYFTNEN